MYAEFKYLPFRRLIFLAFLFLKTLQFLRRLFFESFQVQYLPSLATLGQKDTEVRMSVTTVPDTVLKTGLLRYDLIPHWKTIAFPLQLSFYQPHKDVQLV